MESLTSDKIADVIGCMPRQVQYFDLKSAELETLIVLEQVVEGMLVLTRRDLIPISKELLDLLNSSTDTDLGR
jgi:hypothetical protein